MWGVTPPNAGGSNLPQLLVNRGLSATLGLSKAENITLLA